MFIPVRFGSDFFRQDNYAASMEYNDSAFLVERGAQGMAAVVPCETSQPPPSALINWTLAVICSIRRFIAVR